MLYTGMIFFFSFFWTSMMFQPNDIANNLKEHGSFIPGIRPGKTTAKFLEDTMVRLTLAGAVFLAIIAVFPSLFGQRRGGSMDEALIYFMSGTSILIVVSVALDMVEKLNAMLVMRNYEGVAKDAMGGLSATKAVAGGSGAGGSGAGGSGPGGGGWGRRSG
jgi:preprotein translocase subunit SecY